MLPGKTYTVQDGLRVGRRYGWLVAVGLVIGLFCSLVTSARLPNVYQSEMLVQIVPQRVPESFVRSTVFLTPSARSAAFVLWAAVRAPSR